MALLIGSLSVICLLWLSPALALSEAFILTLAISGCLAILALSTLSHTYTRKDNAMYHNKNYGSGSGSVSLLTIVAILALAIAIIGGVTPIMALALALANKIIASLDSLVMIGSPALLTVIPLCNLEKINEVVNNTVKQYGEDYNTIRERIDNVGYKSIFSLEIKAGDITESGKYRVMLAIESWLIDTKIELKNDTKDIKKYVTRDLNNCFDDWDIRHLLDDIFDKAREKITLECIDESISWDWLVSKGRIAGSFPKRIAKWLKSMDIKADSNILGTIGSLFQENIENESRTFYLDYANRIDWSSGDYGDSGSCFWNCHASAKDTLNEYDDFTALRMYEVDQRQHYNYDLGEYETTYVLSGSGRCWMIIDTPRANQLIIFNAYSKKVDERWQDQNKYRLIDFARFLATLYGLSYKKIGLCNNGEKSGDLWINHKDNNETQYGDGYIIGDWSSIENIENYDLEIDTETENITLCDICNERINTDNDYYQMYNSDIYCESCASDNLSSCERCGETMHNDDVYPVNRQYRNYSGSHSYTESYCQSCTERIATQCERCGEHFHDKDGLIITDSDGTSYCQSCVENEGLSICDCCGEFTSDPLDDDCYCLSCSVSESENENK
jgi:hypothetical protein